MCDRRKFPSTIGFSWFILLWFDSVLNTSVLYENLTFRFDFFLSLSQNFSPLHFPTQFLSSHRLPPIIIPTHIIHLHTLSIPQVLIHYIDRRQSLLKLLFKSCIFRHSAYSTSHTLTFPLWDWTYYILEPFFQTRLLIPSPPAYKIPSPSPNIISFTHFTIIHIPQHVSLSSPISLCLFWTINWG